MSGKQHPEMPNRLLDRLPAKSAKTPKLYRDILSSRRLNQLAFDVVNRWKKTNWELQNGMETISVQLPAGTLSLPEEVKEMCLDIQAEHGQKGEEPPPELKSIYQRLATPRLAAIISEAIIQTLNEVIDAKPQGDIQFKLISGEGAGKKDSLIIGMRQTAPQDVKETLRAMLRGGDSELVQRFHINLQGMTTSHAHASQMRH